VKVFSEEEITTCEHFLVKSKILIVDDEFGSRVALKNSLTSFKIVPTNIRVAGSVTQAKIEIERFSPNIIFSEHLLEDGFGTSMRFLKSNVIFILASYENSRAVLAHAAEHEIKNFVFKPYERNHFRTVLFQAILMHLNPSETSRKLELGKTKLRIGLTDEALELFLAARQLNQSLAEIDAWIGRSLESLSKSPNEIESAYVEGLAISPHHFKCLEGLYLSFRAGGKVQEAYACLKKLVIYYPENPGRLVDVIELALKAKSYQDLEIYYRIFCRILTKTVQLENSLASAFSVVGNYYLAQKQKDRALRSFQRALEITSNKSKFTDYACARLSEAGYIEDANNFSSVFNGAGFSPDDEVA